ncbi:Os09g0512800, partial [Oryza sativa Japonica Group]
IGTSTAECTGDAKKCDETILFSGWCGEVRNVIYSDNGTVTVVYRVILRGTDGEAYREATGTAPVHEGRNDDAVAAAEEAAFCKACARFGFGLYLYHQDEIP